MEDGFFILIFIAIAVIQGIGQKRRQDAKKKYGPKGAPPRPPQRPKPSTEVRPAQQSTTKQSSAKEGGSEGLIPVSYTHLTLPTSAVACRSRWSPYH